MRTGAREEIGVHPLDQNLKDEYRRPVRRVLSRGSNVPFQALEEREEYDETHDACGGDERDPAPDSSNGRERRSGIVQGSPRARVTFSARPLGKFPKSKTRSVTKFTPNDMARLSSQSEPRGGPKGEDEDTIGTGPKEAPRQSWFPGVSYFMALSKAVKPTQTRPAQKSPPTNQIIKNRVVSKQRPSLVIVNDEPPPTKHAPAAKPPCVQHTKLAARRPLSIETDISAIVLDLQISETQSSLQSPRSPRRTPRGKLSVSPRKPTGIVMSSKEETTDSRDDSEEISLSSTITRTVMSQSKDMFMADALVSSIGNKEEPDCESYAKDISTDETEDTSVAGLAKDSLHYSTIHENSLEEESTAIDEGKDSVDADAVEFECIEDDPEKSESSIGVCSLETTSSDEDHVLESTKTLIEDNGVQNEATTEDGDAKVVSEDEQLEEIAEIVLQGDATPESDKFVSEDEKKEEIAEKGLFEIAATSDVDKIVSEDEQTEEAVEREYLENDATLDLDTAPGERGNQDNDAGIVGEHISTERNGPIKNEGDTVLEVSSWARRPTEEGLGRSVGVQTSTPFAEYIIEVSHSERPRRIALSKGSDQSDEEAREEPTRRHVGKHQERPPKSLEKSSSLKHRKHGSYKQLNGQEWRQKEGDKQKLQEAHKFQRSRSVPVQKVGKDKDKVVVEPPFPAELTKSFTTELEASGVKKFWFLW